MSAGAVQINNAVQEVNNLTQDNEKRINNLSIEVNRFKVYPAVKIHGGLMITKRSVFCGLLLFFVCTRAFCSKEYTLKNIPKAYIGTYIPVQYDTVLKRTKSHIQALRSSTNEYHDILMLNNTICYSDAGFHDGYAIPADEFQHFRFVQNRAGQFIVDGKGNSYRKISSHPKDYAGFEAYLLSVIFEDAVSLKNVSVKKNTVTINNQTFTVILDVNFFQYEGVSLWLSGAAGDDYALLIDGISAKIVESRYKSPKSPERLVSQKCFAQFPLFYWHDKNLLELELWHLSKQQLRYLRNLVFARHGYTFKSTELQKLYENFSWYKRNPAFSEQSFSNEEKEFVKSVLYHEEYNHFKAHD